MKRNRDYSELVQDWRVTMKIPDFIWLAFVLGLASPSAFAIVVNFSFEGTVDFDNGGNIFGLVVGEQVTVSGTFDDVLTGNGSEQVFYGQGTGNTLVIVVGDITYDETDDVLFSTGAPTLLFGDGLFTDFSFNTNPDPIFQSGAQGFAGFEGLPTPLATLGGDWDVGSFNKTPVAVPVPTATWLFGSALGFLGWNRRKLVRGSSNSRKNKPNRL